MVDDLVDAGTKNAIKLWKPPGGSLSAFIDNNFICSNYWMEVSVLGLIYIIDPTHRSKNRIASF